MRRAQATLLAAALSLIVVANLCILLFDKDDNGTSNSQALQLKVRPKSGYEPVRGRHSSLHMAVSVQARSAPACGTPPCQGMEQFGRVVMAGFTTAARDDWLFCFPLFCLEHGFAETIYVIEPYKIWADRQVPEVGQWRLRAGHGGGAGRDVATQQATAAEVLAALVPDVLIVRDGPMLAQAFKWFPLLRSARFKALFPIGQFPPPELYATINHTIPDTSVLKPPSPRMFAACDGSQLYHRSQVLLYPAEVHGRKGQLDFLKALKRDGLQGWVVNFVGKLRKPDYVAQVRAMCRRKRVDCRFAGQVAFPELMQFYRNASHVVLMSKKDPNPRVVYEGLACNLPFVTSRNVTLPAALEGLGRQLDVKSKTFQADLHAFLQRDLQDAPYRFARKWLTETAVYPDIMRNITQAARSA